MQSKFNTQLNKEYVETNKANIRQVMADLKAINNPNLKYSAFLLDDGKSFVHFVMRLDEQAQKSLSELPSFREFQDQLKESGPEAAPKAEPLNLIGSSWDIFYNEKVMENIQKIFSMKKGYLPFHRPQSLSQLRYVPLTQVLC